MKHPCWTSAAILCLFATQLDAQMDSAERRASSSPRVQMQTQFDRKAPKLGQTLPDFELLDSAGAKVSSRDLRGHYTVLVFGCLT